MTSLIVIAMSFSGILPAQTTADQPGQATALGSDMAVAPERPLSSVIRVELRATQTTVSVGGQVMLEFVVQNTTDEPVTLTVPGALVGRQRPELGMGLPLEHVFSADRFRGLEIVSEQNPNMGDRVTRKPEFPIPPITLAPFGTVGIRFDVARFYPGLHQSGTYRLSWRPYGGAVASPPLTIKVVQYKHVVMETEYGTLAMRLLYDKAPGHVANFLDLVEKRFYNGKTFHVLYPNQFLLGGCPRGVGTGKRPDCIQLEPERNDTPFDLGTVAMALIESDPNSASSQFFICLSRQPGWDGRYTAFAKVDGPQSLEVLRRLGGLPVDGEHAPAEPLLIKSMSAVDAPFTPRLPR